MDRSYTMKVGLRLSIVNMLMFFIPMFLFIGNSGASFMVVFNSYLRGFGALLLPSIVFLILYFLRKPGGVMSLVYILNIIFSISLFQVFFQVILLL